MTVQSARDRAIPPATVARLADYEQALGVLARTKAATSSDELAAAAGVSPSTLRRDLSYLGSYGIRGVGYDIELLTAEVSRALGAHRAHRVALVGVGNLGSALANYPGFVSRGLTIAALFDVDPRRVGQRMGGVVIDAVENIAEVCHRETITIGVIATPERAAQQAADALVDAGVTAILAFTPGLIQVPAGVELRKVDLAVELQVLAFHASRRDRPRPATDTTKNLPEITGARDVAGMLAEAGTSGTDPSVPSSGAASAESRSADPAPPWPVVDVRRAVSVSTALSRSAG